MAFVLAVAARGRDSTFGDALGLATTCMLFVPLVHARHDGRAAVLHASYPIGRARHAIVRMLCGAAVGAAALAVPVFVAAVLRAGVAGRPAAVAVPHTAGALLAGIIVYLVMASAALHSTRGLVAFVIGWGFFAFVIVAGEATIDNFKGAPVLAVLLAVVAASVAAHHWRPRLSPWRLLPDRAWTARPAPAPAADAERAPRRAPVLRLPALPERGLEPPRVTGFGRQVRLYVRMYWRHARFGLAVGVGLTVVLGGGTAEPSGPPELLWYYAVVLLGAAWVWPLLLWPDEGVRRRQHEETLPAERLTGELARTAAGGAWLVALVVLAVPALRYGAVLSALSGPEPPMAASDWEGLGNRGWSALPDARLLAYAACVALGAYCWNVLPLVIWPRSAGRGLSWSRAAVLIVILPASMAMLSPLQAAGQGRWGPALALLLAWLVLPGAVVAAVSAAGSRPSAASRRRVLSAPG
ncbi:MAG TPA: hypothetical protein VFQ45_00165 [Longimicrobium sp.]|nr:hypothetical protein [Longimicrobium sp.]